MAWLRQNSGGSPHPVAQKEPNAFGLFDIWSANRRGARRSERVAPLWQDGLLLVAGGVVYMAILHGHGWLFGMPVAFSAG